MLVYTIHSEFTDAGSKCNKDEILKEMLEERKNKVAKTKEYRNQKFMKELIEKNR